MNDNLKLTNYRSSDIKLTKIQTEFNGPKTAL